MQKTKMTTQDKSGATKVDLGLLEEDDEFEEFPAHGKRSATKRASVYKKITCCRFFLNFSVILVLNYST